MGMPTQLPEHEFGFPWGRRMAIEFIGKPRCNIVMMESGSFLSKHSQNRSSTLVQVVIQVEAQREG